MKALLLALLAITAALAGCLSSDTADGSKTPVPVGPTDTAWYHLSEARPLPAGTPAVKAVGTYNAIGGPTFEPTMAVTSSGALFMTSFVVDIALQYTMIHRSTDGGLNWTNVGPFLGPTELPQVVNSNDPFLFSDPWTDRLVKADMCATLAGFCMEISDDDGDTWTPSSVATGLQPAALDHQSFAAAPKTSEDPTTTIYPNNMVFCVNRGTSITGAWCSNSPDGGITWGPLVPGFPADSPQCSGLHGHVKGADDGVFYRGQRGCDGATVFRSLDGGLTWSEHLVAPGGTQDHNVEIGTGPNGTVYAFWIDDASRPMLAISTDQGETWGTPLDVAPPGLTASGFATIAAGDAGRVAFGYIGTASQGGLDAGTDAQWNGYIGMVTDTTAADPVITTVQVNAVDDPLDTGRPCGAIRCGGFGDFIDMEIDPSGRPYIALAHNGFGSAGIVGTLETGPALRGEAGTLPTLELPGLASLEN